MIGLSFFSCSLSKVESEQYFDCFSENSKCLSFLAMTSWKRGEEEVHLTFCLTFRSTLISLLLYFRVIFGFAPPPFPFATCRHDICRKMAFRSKTDQLHGEGCMVLHWRRKWDLHRSCFAFKLLSSSYFTSHKGSFWNKHLNAKSTNFKLLASFVTLQQQKQQKQKLNVWFWFSNKLLLTSYSLETFPTVLVSASKEIIFCQSREQYISQFQANSIPCQWLPHILEK